MRKSAERARAETRAIRAATEKEKNDLIRERLASEAATEKARLGLETQKANDTRLMDERRLNQQADQHFSGQMQDTMQQDSRQMHERSMLTKKSKLEAGENATNRTWKSGEGDKDRQVMTDQGMNRLIAAQGKQGAEAQQKEYDRAHDLLKATPEYIDNPENPAQKMVNPKYQAAYANYMKYQQNVATPEGEADGFARGVTGEAGQGQGDVAGGVAANAPATPQRIVVQGNNGVYTDQYSQPIAGAAQQGGGAGGFAGGGQVENPQQGNENVAAKPYYTEKTVRNGNSYGTVIDPHNNPDVPYYGNHQVTRRVESAGVAGAGGALSDGDRQQAMMTSSQAAAVPVVAAAPGQNRGGVALSDGDRKQQMMAPITIQADKRKIRPSTGNMFTDPSHWAAQPLSNGQFWTGAGNAAVESVGEGVTKMGRMAVAVPKSMYQIGSRLLRDSGSNRSNIDKTRQNRLDERRRLVRG